MANVSRTPESLVLRELTAPRREAFRALLVRSGATNPRLFGSVARGAAHPGSDIDILVDTDEQIAAIVPLQSA